MPHIKLAFIGAGRMATAIVHGILQEGIFEAPQIGCMCGNDGTGAELAKKSGIRYIPETEKLLLKNQIVVLACKPQQLDDLLGKMDHLTEGSLIISILAGARIKKLAKVFPNARNIVRSMPNTPGQIGAGVTVFSPQKPLESQDLLAVESILSSLGMFMELPEDQLDAVTAVSGSGPAYLFEFAIAMRKAAVNAGLSEEVAGTLTRETIFGAAKLMENSWMKPEELRDAVTSPGGTTEAALNAMMSERPNLHRLLDNAVSAAKKRSIELSK